MRHSPASRASSSHKMTAEQKANVKLAMARSLEKKGHSEATSRELWCHRSGSQKGTEALLPPSRTSNDRLVWTSCLFRQRYHSIAEAGSTVQPEWLRSLGTSMSLCRVSLDSRTGFA
jgi:hypothetical protein